VFTLAGALLLSFIKVQDARLKQEAIIGIIYAVSSAATVLFISKAAHSDSDISEVLFGSLFTATWGQIGTIAIVFGILGLVHAVFSRQFFEITEKFERHETDDIGTFNLWNFLFYISIGLAIVVAVRVGGVIPVFAYLVVPPVSAILLVRGKGTLVALTLVISVLGSVFGILFSVGYDFPAGPSVVAMLGALFVFASLLRLVRGRP
jgi:ABC-type Mn2+/Zn2+ transport system permease subunit